MSRWDVVVAGLGAVGSATLLELARRGLRVVGIDRFVPPHDRGSSHGRSRIIREAYFEEPRYVPLVRRAYERWEQLERESRRRLFHRTGGLTFGPEGGALPEGARLSAETHALPHERLDAAAIRARIPALAPEPGMAGVLEPRAGILDPEACLTAALEVAHRLGAEVRTAERVVTWRAVAGGVEVATQAERLVARRLVIAAGPWARELLPDTPLPLRVQRNVLLWFEPLEPALFTPDRFPVFLCEYAPGRVWYGFPDTGDGVKLALHDFSRDTTADTVSREVTRDDVASVRALVRRFLPAADGALRASTVCLYTSTPDGHFILDRHPAHPEVIVASACSGHGFKFASALGEVLADLVTDAAPAFDLAPFALARFA